MNTHLQIDRQENVGRLAITTHGLFPLDNHDTHRHRLGLWNPDPGSDRT